tara:strand:+ start:1239 stop:3674 length:2436 start_codon:yes stop_codon:yes gene_type:complete
MKRKEVLSYLVFGGVLVLSLALIYQMGGGFTGMAIFTTGNESDFDGGSYLNTSYNGSAVILDGENLTGSYTSEIFDALLTANWNNLSVSQSLPSVEYLFAFDNDKDLWKSTDGISWSEINDSYFSQDILGIAVDSNNDIFVRDKDEQIHKSTDSGVTWIELNDSYTDKDSANQRGLVVGVENTSLSFQVMNCSLSNCADGSWQSVDLDDVGLQSRYFRYKVDFVSDSSSLTPQLFNVSLDYSLLASVPVVNIVVPTSDASFGFNESINLNFTVVNSSSALDSCWYSFDSGENNVSVLNCANTTFDVAGDGDYNLVLYANESVSGLEGSDSVSFSVLIGAPSIALDFPVGNYLNYNESIYFNYSATDVDGVGACELWGDFDGDFKLNQTDTSVVSGVDSNFILNLSDGTYVWNVECNDSLGNLAVNGNQTFYVDTAEPDLTLSGPSGVKTSRTGIVLDFEVNDSSPTSCKYNVFRGLTEEIVNTSVLCNSSTSFDVTVDADFVLNFFVNDSAEHNVNDSIEFSVDTSSGGNPTPSSSGGGGGGGSSRRNVINTSGKLELSSLTDLIIEPGEKRNLNLKVKNSGLSFLNDCKLVGDGVYSSWVSSSQSLKIGGGESVDFDFEINVQEDIGHGSYSVSVSVSCEETSESEIFLVDVIEEQLSFSLVNIERGEEDNIVVDYILSEFSGVEQSVEIQFLLLDSSENKVAEIVDVKEIAAGSEEGFTTVISLDSSLAGDFNLIVNINSETYSTFVQENVVLGAPVSGFAIFNNGGRLRSALYVGGIVLFLVFALVIVSRIVKLKKKSVKTRDYTVKK